MRQRRRVKSKRIEKRSSAIEHFIFEIPCCSMRTFFFFLFNFYLLMSIKHASTYFKDKKLTW